MRNDKQFNAALNTAIKSAQESKRLIQDLTVDALNWAVAHGDTSRLNRIHSNMADGFNTADWNKWLRFVTAIDGVRVHKDQFKVQAAKLAAVDLGALDLWYTAAAKAEKPAADFDISKFFNNSIKRLLKATNNGAELNLLEQEALRVMQAALASRITDKDE